ncbi:MAG TPA: GNAT family N-acetyltransferase [Anaerolineales bacterium]|nr:GNAT family N-acetyltransferase [Anaerolineales bacterium]
MDSRNLEAPGSPASIEAATWRDLLTVRQLERVCFPRDAWPLLDIIGVLALPNVIRLKATLNGLVVGFIAIDVRPSQDLAWVATIGVLPEFQRRGIGSALLQASEGQLKVGRLRLSVRASNQAALALYQRFQFQQVEVWPRYYQDGEQALVLEKRLT